MYTELVMLVMGVSLVLYMILGGADFGAGIIELFIGDKSNSTVSRAMAPVWEANHMWLVICVVILFNGFPKGYVVLSTNLHIPVLLFLLAIIMRGTAFTFRHYDAYHDKSEHIYSAIFRYSSLLAVFFLGVTISGFFSGTIPRDITGGFSDNYIIPWFNWFSFSTGIFLITISSYIAGIFLLGEVTTQDGYDNIKKFILRLFILSVLSGISIFLSSLLLDLQFHKQFLAHPISIGTVAIASIMVPYIFKLIATKQIWKMRFIVGFQVVLIMAGWFMIQWPNLVIYADGSTLSIYDAASPLASMKVLFIALTIGVIIIFPGLFYLFKIFKSDKNLDEWSL